MSDKWSIGPARAQDRRAAFQLLFSHVDTEERNSRVHNAETMLAAGEIDPQGVVAAWRHGCLEGAVVCVPLPGASGLFWPPRVVDGPAQQRLEDQLVRYTLDWLRRRRAKLAQALLAPAEISLATPLLRNGFAEVTTLRYLRRELADYRPDAPAGVGLALRSFCDATADVFRKVLEQTYLGTHDCPELNGVRTIEEVLEGHRGRSEFDPGRWWLAWQNDVPVGVLLLASMPEWGSWDISYVGVVPEARRRGIGRALTQLAMTQARAADVERLTLAVDSRNRPALNLYERLGFQPGDTRHVLLNIFAGAPGARDSFSTSARH